MSSSTPEEIWAEYIITRKIQYLEGYRQTIGREYEANSQHWDSLAEREWLVIEENLKAGFGVADAIKRQLGEDFFERQLENLEINIVDTEFETVDFQGTETTIYTISDFVMLSNQGIFRDDIFSIDKERRWEKKTIKEVEEHGYVHLGYAPTNDIVYIVFRRPVYE